MQIAVLTAIYDRYDTLKPFHPQLDLDVEWICVTDSEALARGDEDPHGWTIVHEPRPNTHPNRAAKPPKMLPMDYAKADASVWVDASFKIVSPSFVVGVLTHLDPVVGVAQFRHPWRACLYTEASASMALAKYRGEPLLEQVSAYRRAGMPAGWGLWATGVIARRHTDETRSWGATWLDECNRFSFQDQVSHPFACWLHGVRPAGLPGTHFVNPWLAFQGSGRH